MKENPVLPCILRRNALYAAIISDSSVAVPISITTNVKLPTFEFPPF
jgi:hypothetical protein